MANQPQFSGKIIVYQGAGALMIDCVDTDNVLAVPFTVKITPLGQTPITVTATAYKNILIPGVPPGAFQWEVYGTNNHLYGIGNQTMGVIIDGKMYEVLPFPNA